MDEKAGTAGSALTIFLGAMAAVGTAALLLLSGQSVRLSLNVATIAAFIIGALSIVPAARSAALPSTVRHLYNSHYAAFFGAFSMAAGMVIIGSVSDDRLLVGIASLGIILSGIWGAAHLWAGVAATGADSLRAGAVAACVAIALMHPNALVVLLCAASAFASVKISLPAEPLEKPGPGWGMLSFILLNMIVIVGPAVVLLGYTFAMFKQTTEGAMLNPTHGAPNMVFPKVLDTPGFFLVMGARPMIAMAGGCVVAMASLAWPRMKIGSLQRGLCCACATIAAGIGGHLLFGPSAMAAFASCALLIAASALTSFQERAKRTPAIIAAFAVAFTIMLHSLTGFPESAGYAFLAWVADMMVLLVVWLVGYFAGIRALRNAMEITPTAGSVTG
ncbi:hypothetical protein BH09SUM1_BH09SUM1_29150 [soil metagenome]